MDGAKKPVFTNGWLNMRSICPNSATLITNHLLHVDPSMWNLEGMFFCSIPLLEKMAILNSFWPIAAHSSKWTGQEACTYKWMVENEEHMPKLCNTKMAHKPNTACRPLNVEFGRYVCLVQFRFSKMVILNSFWPLAAHSSKWTGPRSLCSQMGG